MALLDVRDLSIDIHGIRPLDGISFHVDKGEILGIVGESGSGKSLTALSIMGLLPLIGGRIERGSVVFDGREMVGLPEPDLRRLRGKRIAFITQNPMTSLDPVIRVGEQIDQMAMLHLGMDARAARARSVEIMEKLRIPEAATIYHHYPHQLSGGMKQRIVIAMALAADPDLIIADEPTTALDVTIQAQIVDLLAELVRDRGVALILITHDMGVVAQICDRVVVLYAGRVAESNQVGAIFAAPRHPYTSALIRCIPREETAPGALIGIPGAVPSVTQYPAGCRFHPRCDRRGEPCATTIPALTHPAGGGDLACHFPEAAR
jgi:peptide/nickel transport system ATP-binding protein